MEQKNILITGVTGQIGSVLATKLIEQGHKVYGIKRWASDATNTRRVDHLYNHPNFKLIYGDLRDYASIVDAVQLVKPDWFINMGAMSFVKASFSQVELTMDVVGTGVLRCLEAVKKYAPESKFLGSASSEMFGSAPALQSETTVFKPCSPYGIAKVVAHQATVLYRQAYGLKAYNSITFNTEGPGLRSELFFPMKVIKGAVRIKNNQAQKLVLGNLAAKRDWNHIDDSTNAMIKILESDQPDDYCIGSGNAYSCQEFVEKVFAKLSLNWQDHVEIDPKFFREKEVDWLQADITKIKSKLGWEPKISFDQLLDEMLNHEIELAEKEKYYSNYRK